MSACLKSTRAKDSLLTWKPIVNGGQQSEPQTMTQHIPTPVLAVSLASRVKMFWKNPRKALPTLEHLV